jgi:hypothetical protein
MVGSALIPVVPAAQAGVPGTAIGRIAWPADMIPPSLGWHPCLLAEVIPLDPDPQLLHHVWENRKIAQKNVTIVDVPLAWGGFVAITDFRIGNASLQRAANALRIQSNADDGLLLFLEADPVLLVSDRVERTLTASVPIRVADREERLGPIETLLPVPVAEVSSLRARTRPDTQPGAPSAEYCRINGQSLLALRRGASVIPLEFRLDQVRTLRLITFGRIDALKVPARVDIAETDSEGKVMGAISICLRSA